MQSTGFEYGNNMHSDMRNTKILTWVVLLITPYTALWSDNYEKMHREESCDAYSTPQTAFSRTRICSLLPSNYFQAQFASIIYNEY